MTINKFRQDLFLLGSSKPIIISTKAGAKHKVPNRKYLMVPPVGELLVLVQKNGRMRFVDVSQVKSVGSSLDLRKPVQKQAGFRPGFPG